MDKLIKKIKKLHWILTWSGNWPLLDTCLQQNSRFDDESIKIIGTRLIGTLVSLNENRVLTNYRSAEDFARLNNYFINKFKKNPQFLKQSVRGYRLRVNKDLRALQQISHLKNLSLLSNKKLAELFLKARFCFSYNTAIDIYDWYMERVFTPILQGFLEKKLAKLRKTYLLTDYLNILITPHKKSIIFKERTEFFNIIKYIRSDKKLKTKIKKGGSLEKVFSDDSRLEILVKKYLAKYIWMTVLVNNPPQTLKTVWREIKTLIKTDAALEIKAKRLGDNYDKKTIERSFRYIKKLRPPKEILFIIKGLREMAFLRTEDYVVVSESSYYVIPLYSEVGRRLGIDYYGMKEFMPEEIIKFLKTGRKVAKKELKKRLTINCLITIDGKRHFFEGQQATAIKKVIIDQIKVAAGRGKVLSGVVANKGKINGKVKIVLNHKAMETLQGGEILVMATASASFVAGMRKAGGIIAEHGGLTSHPVIVARELNIPCVVGVKGATTHLKDGDLVEMDANTGIVRKL